MIRKIGVSLVGMIILTSALFITAWYTSSNLEMMWLLVWIVIPVIGFIVGGLLGLVTKAIFKVSMQVVAGLVIYSVLLYSALMIEESGIGVIRDKFDEYAQTLNKAERNKPFHELSLGEGSILYFATDKDDKFNLNFEYEGEKRINRDQILQLARQWLIAKGYTPGDTAEFYLYPITYRKNISFDLTSQNNIGVIFGIEKDPRHQEQQDIKLNLSLRRKQGILTFEETGRSYQSVK